MVKPTYHDKRQHRNVPILWYHPTSHRLLKHRRWGRFLVVRRSHGLLLCSGTCAGLCKFGGSSEWNIGLGCPDSVFYLQSDLLGEMNATHHLFYRLKPPGTVQTSAHSPKHKWAEVATTAVSDRDIMNVKIINHLHSVLCKLYFRHQHAHKKMH